MKESAEELIKKIEKLFKNEKYTEIIDLLPDTALQIYNNAILYSYKARALCRCGNIDESMNCAQKAISIDNICAMAYFARGNAWRDKKDYDKAIKDYNKAIQLDIAFASAYLNRGNAWSNKKEYNKALEDYNKAIQLDETFAKAYYSRGNLWYDKKEYDKALEDYNKAIQLDETDVDGYNSRGNVWAEKKEYDKALNDYNKAIQLKEKYAVPYYNRAILWYEKHTYNKAIEDYNKVILLDKNDFDGYYGRAISNAAIGEYINAINDYKTYIELKNNPDDYFTIVAQSEIKKLQKNLNDPRIGNIDTIVEDIKKLLLFNKPCITHYTSFTAAKAMVMENSLLRLSEGVYLNDSSEGMVLFDYLEFVINKIDGAGNAEIFVERPFIGSFVSEHKHDDLDLWRFYGKEAEMPARGCALTINKEKFINTFKAKLPISKTNNITENITFYKVAYIVNKKFVLPHDEDEDEEQYKSNSVKLNELLKDLKAKIKELDNDQRIKITTYLNDIAYLFKNANYQHENEVRLVVGGVGIKKEFNTLVTPSRVYIEMVPMIPVLEKITIGTKVEQKEEWAALFNYHIKELDVDSKIKIVISHLPFR